MASWYRALQTKQYVCGAKKVEINPQYILKKTNYPRKLSMRIETDSQILFELYTWGTTQTLMMTPARARVGVLLPWARFAMEQRPSLSQT